MSIMNIISWNMKSISYDYRINNFSDFINYNISINRKPNIILLQEVVIQTNIKMKEISNTVKELGYTLFYNNIKSKVAFAIENNLVDLFSITKDSNYYEDLNNNVIIGKIYNTNIINCYVPNNESSRPLCRSDFNDYFSGLVYDLSIELDNENIILGGDLNNYIYDEDIIPERIGGTYYVNNRKLLLDAIKQLKLKDYYYENKYDFNLLENNYTTSGKSGRFDYLLTKTIQENAILDASIYENFFGSDHRPIWIQIELNTYKPESFTKTVLKLEYENVEPIVEPKVELLQQLIKIKSTICNDHKQYYITNENDEFIIDIYNNSQMDWILSGDFADDETILIEENVIYNINDKNVIDSIKMYTYLIGEIINYEELIQKFNITDINYNNLSFEGKIIFLFMATKMFESGEYLNNEEHDYEEMYLFQVNDGVEIEDDVFIKHEEDDVFSKHFINIGDFENIDFMKYEWYNKNQPQSKPLPPSTSSRNNRK